MVEVRQNKSIPKATSISIAALEITGSPVLTPPKITPTNKSEFFIHDLYLGPRQVMTLFIFLFRIEYTHKINVEYYIWR